MKLHYDVTTVEGKFKHLSLPMAEFRKFGPALLGLGDLSKESPAMEVLSANLDLQGFTSFCTQMDPQLVVPEFLNDFVSWVFRRITENFTKEVQGDQVVLWGKLPFFAKYLGDGLLLLWDTAGLGAASLGNIVINLYKVSQAYTDEFIPQHRNLFFKVPARLRCGIARGQVIPIGGGNDFTGPCINLSARLQKTSQLSFAFPRKGFDPNACFGSIWRSQFVSKFVAIRGMTQDELIFVPRAEFENLPPEDKAKFRDPGAALDMQEP